MGRRTHRSETKALMRPSTVKDIWGEKHDERDSSESTSLKLISRRDAEELRRDFSMFCASLRVPIPL